MPGVDSSEMGGRPPFSGSGKRLFSPRICAKSLNLKSTGKLDLRLCLRVNALNKNSVADVFLHQRIYQKRSKTEEKDDGSE